ncbi:MAG: hypothetical protein J6B90_00945, partial [Lachnospiraceae bacterium]|nr:hypothetical protein [Lachnospiraceae bacterium]
QLTRAEELANSQVSKAQEAAGQVNGIQSNRISQADAQTKPVNDIDLSIEENIPVRKPNADVREISLTFNAKEDFGYIGQDSDIENLDMQKAISDMKKDGILRQYQYFVGSAENLLPKNITEDGAVFLKF